ncbi:dephospho-kinase domain-containing [Stylonychia lemnae]|uniref:Dephospho-kinase domain-containing n=1 Tax=Stylonychia lemnae TaxID=5949 RepID=A0A078AX88_STYLE|nr:dephospho-kinase domain-containing [Stylonychia lemnae]|eukprot:CDW86686.1 dephospho-kinase domain-containing [Stylonychia lemnae]
MGINWNRIDTKFKRSPQRLLVLIYIVNFVLLYYGFGIPFLIQLFINILEIVAVFFGSQFQIIGLTGGIATGKSTVSSILSEIGFDIIDTDKISRELMDNDVGLQQAVKKAFGPTILDDNGVIDRDKLGAVVFSDAEKRKLINKLTHPRIFRKIIQKVIQLKLFQRKPLVVLDAPLLFETKILEFFCYPIITVYCEDGQTQLNRLMTRNNLTEDDAMRKVNAQMPISIKVKQSDIIVENGGSLDDLHKFVEDRVIKLIYQKLGYIDSAL